MRVCACVVGLGIVLGGLAQASYAPTPPGPIGWETRITPGFDPPIEHVLVFREAGPQRDETFDKALRAWGPEAAPALVKLYRDPAWEAHRWAILGYLKRVDGPFVASFLEEAAKALEVAPPVKGPGAIWPASLLAMLAERDAAAADAIAFGVLSDTASPHYESIIHYLQDRAGHEDGAACRAKAEEIAAETDDEHLGKRIRQALERRDAEARADEPMRLVLDREAKGEKP